MDAWLEYLQLYPALQERRLECSWRKNIIMSKEENKSCENNYHKSFETFQGQWLCRQCKEVFSSEDIEKIMVERRRGFSEPEE